jgi:geranylgeranyl reductase family protein
LAGHGHRVVCIDKRAFPRNKACGDGLTPRALAALERMGMGRLWQQCRQIDGIRLVNRRFEIDAEIPFRDSDAPAFGGVLTRLELDHQLVLAAERAGARIITETAACDLVAAPGGGVVVRLERAGGSAEISARFAILAEGANGRLATRLRRARKSDAPTTFALRQYFTVGRDSGRHFEIHAPLLCDGIPLAGYCWLFPVDVGLVNVGVGFSKMSRDRPSLRRAYAESLASLSEHGRLDGEPAGPVMGAPIPTNFDPARSAGPGWLVVGDAAGLANPFTGEGIAQALESAEIAAAFVHSALQTGSAVAAEYSAALARHFHRQLRLSGATTEILGLVRAYSWTELGVRASAMRQLRTAGLIRDIVLDRRTDVGAYGWARLVANIAAPTLWSALDRVAERMLGELAHISPLFAQTAAELRLGVGATARYGSLLILSVGAAYGDLAEPTLCLAEVAELATLQAFFHDDVPPHSYGAASAVASLNILGGDAVIARMFNVMSGLTRSVAEPLSIVLQSQAAALATARLGADETDDIPRRPPPMTDCVRFAVGVIANRNNKAAQQPLESWAASLLCAGDLLLAAAARPERTSVGALRLAETHLRHAEQSLAAVPEPYAFGLAWTVTCNASSLLTEIGRARAPDDARELSAGGQKTAAD